MCPSSAFQLFVSALYKLTELPRTFLPAFTPAYPQPSLLKISSAPTLRQMTPAKDLVFGHTFTDHMLLIPWSHETGWGAPSIQPYGPLALDPSSTVLHYASTLFEGMKAYRDADSGVVRLFRPDKNMERMNRSAARLAFPVRRFLAIIPLQTRLTASCAPSSL